MLLFLRDTWPDAKISCVCIDPRKIATAYGIPSVPIRWRTSNRFARFLDKIALTLPQKLGNWVQAIEHMKGFDTFVVAGTSLLSDYRAGPFGSPYALFRWAIAARLCGAKLCFVGAGAGPINNKASRWLLTRVARRASYWSFRDDVSRNFVTTLGVNTQPYRVCPDLAFKLAVPARPAGRPELRQKITVAVGLMDYNGWHGHASPDNAVYECYIGKIIGFVGSLLDRGYRVRLLVGEIADERAVLELKAALAEGAERCSRVTGLPRDMSELVFEDTHSLDDIMLQLSDASIVVASRFHNVVCALKVGHPVISIGYHIKNDALLARFGLEGFCHDIERFDPDILVPQVEELLANIGPYRRRIRQTRVELDEEMAQHEADLARVL